PRHACSSLPPYFCFLEYYRDHPDPHSFPTRRSSDLTREAPTASMLCATPAEIPEECSRYTFGHRSATSTASFVCIMKPEWSITKDRKSTRLNSSHVKISYAVFCLKKKKKKNKRTKT